MYLSLQIDSHHLLVKVLHCHVKSHRCDHIRQLTGKQKLSTIKERKPEFLQSPVIYSSYHEGDFCIIHQKVKEVNDERSLQERKGSSIGCQVE